MARNRREEIVEGARTGATVALLPAMVVGTMSAGVAVEALKPYVITSECKSVFRRVVVPVTTGFGAVMASYISAAGLVLGVGAGIGAGIAAINSSENAMQSVKRLAKYATVCAIGVATAQATLKASPEVLRAGLALAASGAAVYTACTRL